MDLDKVEKLVELLKETNISEINIEDNGEKINIKRGKRQTISDEQFLQTDEKQALSKTDDDLTNEQNNVQEDREEIVAPMVGTFYRAPSPDADPFVNKGEIVNVGEVVCIIEAMKLMNEIEAERNCKIKEILVEDGEPVEYGQPLFIIEKI